MDRPCQPCLSAVMMQRHTLPYVLTGLITLTTAGILLAMGRVPWCACGHVDLWGTLNTSEASQQLLDWYTPSHLLHGILFYGALWLAARRVELGWRLVIATLVEVAWEIVENTNAVIERYREVTISLDYYGDSVLNSVSDIAAMLFGFWLAHRLPIWASVLVVIGFEGLTMVLIRDGLGLNIIMLLYPIEAIKTWQGGG